MTPKEKAKELEEMFFDLDMYDYEGYVYWMEKENAKQCALICVEELIKLYEFENPNRGFKISYWDEVYQELKN